MRATLRRCAVLASMLLIAAACAAQAAAGINAPARIAVGLRFVATESHSPPGSCGCFWLTGGAGDVALPLRHNLSAAVELAGEHAGKVPATSRGLSRITLLAGPRWTHALAAHQGFEAEVLLGAARGFDADFVRGTHPADTATAFAFSAGGAWNLRLRAMTLRLPSLHYVQSELPNGVGTGQRDLRLGVGVVFHPSLPGAAR